ncbi:MAG: hypothetical protein IMZ46_13320, partial [Acidobacteria bacterium]|nr:hypothetical protein [Acidobacteriota bacterium]
MSRAMRATVCEQNNSKWDLGSWNCTMGFRRVKAYVSRAGKARPVQRSILKQRQPQHSPPVNATHAEVKYHEETLESVLGRTRKPGAASVAEKKKAAEKQAAGKKAAPAAKKAAPAAKSLGAKVLSKAAKMTQAEKTRAMEMKTENFILEDDETAPLVHFDVLLDSGATFTMLYDSDFRALGIDQKVYPAQTTNKIKTVGGSYNARLYELRTTVSTSNGLSLVSPKRPVHPDERHEVGAVAPVASLPAQKPHEKPAPDQVQLGTDGLRREGRKIDGPPGGRLSGQLPFLACYASVVPGSGIIWLGEDRSDV